MTPKDAISSLAFYIFFTQKRRWLLWVDPRWIDNYIYLSRGQRGYNVSARQA